MSIDTSGEFWRGAEAADLDAYLAAYTAGGYPVGRVVHSACARDGGTVFTVRGDADEGYVERTCIRCKEVVPILDSEPYAKAARLRSASCPKGGQRFEVATGFSLRDDGNIRWVSVGLRCVRDGTLGVFVDWKIDYEPTDQLFARV